MATVYTTIEHVRSLRSKVETKFRPLFDHLLILAKHSADSGYPRRAGIELRKARQLAGVTAATRAAPKSQKMNRRWLGEKMQHWHSSGDDPIYAVSSYYGSNIPYPVSGFAGPHRDGVSVVRAALSRIESYIPQAERGEHGWTKRDAGELRTIARGLRYYLRHDYPHTRSR
jgi:hypothetical protein